METYSLSDDIYYKFVKHKPYPVKCDSNTKDEKCKKFSDLSDSPSPKEIFLALRKLRDKW